MRQLLWFIVWKLECLHGINVFWCHVHSDIFDLFRFLFISAAPIQQNKLVTIRKTNYWDLETNQDLALGWGMSRTLENIPLDTWKIKQSLVVVASTFQLLHPTWVGEKWTVEQFWIVLPFFLHNSLLGE